MSSLLLAGEIGRLNAAASVASTEQLVVLNSQNQLVRATASQIAISGDDDKVKVSSDDTIPGYLEDKITVGTGLSLSTTSPAGDEDRLISLDATLVALSAYNTNGLLTQTAADTFVGRTLTGTANEITVTNGNGVSGNPTLSLPTGIDAAKIANGTVSSTEFQFLDGVTSSIQTQLNAKQTLDATLTALAAYNTNGLLTQTAADTFVGRTLTGTANRLTVTNGDGVAGAPTFDISASYVGQSSITTLGTIGTGVWNGTIITAAFLRPQQSIIMACSDETTALTTGTAKVTFRMPYGFTLTAVRSSVTTAPTGAKLIVDIKEAGVSIFSTLLSIDIGAFTSVGAAVPAVISDPNLADNAQMTVDITQIGSTVAGAGLKVYLIGVQS